MQTLLLLISVAHAATLSGHVFGPEGDVSGATVVVYDQRFGYATAQTDDVGAWVISGVPDNAYRVRVLPDFSQNLTERWSGETRDVCLSPIYEASSDNTPNVVMELVAGGEVYGEVLSVYGEPVAGAMVAAMSVDPTSTAEDRLASTDGEGFFELMGLPTDLGHAREFVIQVEAEGYPSQYIPGVYDDLVAHVVAFDGAERKSVLDTNLQAGITVRGEVVTPEGLLEEGTAYVYSASTVISTAVVGGYYEAVGLPPGDVLTWVNADDFGTTYFPDADRPTTMIPAEESDVVELDISMPKEARMLGSFVGTGDLSGVSLLAYNDTKTVGVGVLSDAEGAFEIDGLHGGDYTVYVYAESAGAVSGFVGNENEEPEVFTVKDGDDLSGLVFERPDATMLSGSVVDVGTQLPVYGAVVYGAHQDGSSFAVSTGIDGYYEAAGLLPGDWSIEVHYDPYCEEDQDWVSVHYPDARHEDLSDTVTLKAGQAFTWDVVTGSDNDHDRMADAWEQQYQLIVGVDDGALDPDLDGFSNLEEYWLDTDPNTFNEQMPVQGCGCNTQKSSTVSWFAVLAVVWFKRRRFSYR